MQLFGSSGDRFGVSHRDKPLLEGELYFVGQFQKAHVVRHRRAFFADLFRERLLREVAFVDQPLHSQGDFDGVDDFLALDIQQVIVALLQFLQRFRCHDIMFLFFCHVGLLLSYRGINRKEAPEGDASAIPGARGLWDSFHYTCFFRVCQSKKCWNVGFNRV